MAFWNKSKKSDNTPSESVEAKIRIFLDQVTFDTSNLQFAEEDLEQRVRYWLSPQSDVVSLNFFSKPPDLPATRNSSDLIHYIKEMLSSAKGKIVEQEIHSINGFDVVYQIVKLPIPDKAHGLIYIGSLTLPFEKLSYVVKVQCIEHGPTGAREAILFAQNRAGSADHTFEGDQIVMPNWNPDSEEFDAEFPNHPISRLRPLLRQLEHSLQVSEVIFRHHKPFPLPPVQQ